MLLSDLDSDCGDRFLADVLAFCETSSQRPAFAQALTDIGMVRRLYDEFLMLVPDNSGLASEPLCQEAASRKAAWGLLLRLVRFAPDLSAFLVDHISGFLRLTRASKNADGSENWSLSIAVARRRGLPFIGMRNPGARCYINAMVQQLWSVEAFRCALACHVRPRLSTCPERLSSCSCVKSDEK